MVPTNRIAGTALVWCHGLGQFVSNMNEFSLTIPTLNHYYWSKAIENRYLNAACMMGGPNQWDNPTAQTACENLVAYLVANYGVTEVVLTGGSAGGPLGLMKATQGFPGVTVKGWHGIFPVCDLSVAHGNANLTASINIAFPSYPTGTTGRDPMQFAASAFNGLRLRCMGSLADATVPVNQHGQALVTLATGHATEATCILTTGDHGDPSNFTAALGDDFISFLGRCFS